MRANPICFGVAAILIVPAVAKSQKAYQAIVLPNPIGSPWSVAYGAGNGEYGGTSVPPGGSSGSDDRAIIWKGTTPVDVTPPDIHDAFILNSRDGQHVGQADLYAYLWTKEGAVRLHPDGFTYNFSEALGVGGGRQVGIVGFGSMCSECGYYVVRHAAAWSGSRSTLQLLHTPGFEGRPVDTIGTQHVGSAYSTTYHALHWMSDFTFTDLHPTGFQASLATALDTNSQVGWGEVTPYASHALLWRGSAGSVVDLNPAGWTDTIANGVSGEVQVGGGYPTFSQGISHAIAWYGSARNYVDLHLYLPPGFRIGHSNAIDVDATGTIVGNCTEDGTGLPRGVIWRPVRKAGR